MRRTLLNLLVIVIVLGAPCWAHSSDAEALRLVRAGLAAQGGEETLRALRSVRFEARGYRNALEQSERPEGPYVLELDAISETHDVGTGRLLREATIDWPPAESFTSTQVISDGVAMTKSGDRNLAGSAMDVESARVTLALSPERLLLTALAAPDLKREPDTPFHAIPHHVVSFRLRDGVARILLNPYTSLPSAVDYNGAAARAGFWNFLGDTTMRTEYAIWWLAKGGVHYPLQWNVEHNGTLERVVRVVELKLNAPIDEAEFTIPRAVREQFAKKPATLDNESIVLAGGQKPAEIAPGILLFSGSWNVTLVRQEDGIVVLEAPISSGYSAQVLKVAEQRFPGVPIKAVVTTSDSWPHLAGIREYVARGIPIYSLDLNEPILRRVIAQSHAGKPDALERRRRQPVFHLVSSKTVLGSGPNRMELYPLRGATSERQMMAYFPEHKLLYGSDPFQKDGSGAYYYPQTVSELMDAVAREHLAVENFFMMHVGPTLWSELAPVVKAATQEDSPGGTKK